MRRISKLNMKGGRLVAKLVPVVAETEVTPQASLRGTFEIVGDISDQ